MIQYKRDRRILSVWIGGVLFLMLLTLSNCAEVPVTHRRGLHLVSNSELNTMSLQEYDNVIKSSKLSTDQGKIEMIRRVGTRIAKAAEAFLEETGQGQKIKDYQWEFNVLEDEKTANAWCMPGGKVAVYTGILPYTHNETGLAVVMGHEVAHALADHGNERMSQGLLTQLGGQALSTALKQKPQQTQALFMAVFGMTTNVGILLPYSRLHEREADRIGLLIMGRAGYDPREAIGFWERMGKTDQARPPELLSTHPAPDSRIAGIREILPEAIQYYDQSKMKGK
ncbi:M48 family metallopeptidase [Desulfobacula sp.]|uniref:M48 family metallopeptidase n=1 Tax=Desulfobacula sp. TaxID=2593537 RepID=UPI0026288C2C|nr:M48 family metallopeptidase [Desulfobacula sp.]